MVRGAFRELTHNPFDSMPEFPDFFFDPWMPTSEAKQDKFITPRRISKCTKGRGKVETISNSEDFIK